MDEKEFAVLVVIDNMIRIKAHTLDEAERIARDMEPTLIVQEADDSEITKVDAKNLT